MKKVTIIYWSGTGNTEKMAGFIAEGAKANGNPVEIINVQNASKEMVVNSELIAFGCPSMGAEVLEEDFMEPLIESLSDIDFSGKAIALFGSYDWGDGEWMRDWEARMKSYGGNLVEEGLIIHLEPDHEGEEQCRRLGEKLAKA